MDLGSFCFWLAVIIAASVLVLALSPILVLMIPILLIIIIEAGLQTLEFLRYLHPFMQ